MENFAFGFCPYYNLVRADEHLCCFFVQYCDVDAPRNVETAELSVLINYTSRSPPSPSSEQEVRAIKKDPQMH